MRILSLEVAPTKISRGILLGCFVVLCITLAASAQEADVKGSKDHPLISRYPGSVIKEYMQKEYDEFALPLGKVNRGKFEKTQHLEGKVTHIIYEPPVGRSTLEVFRNYEGALRRAGFETLFTCSKDECMVEGGAMMKLYDGYSDPWYPGQEMRYVSA